MDALQEKQIAMHQIKPLFSKWITSKSNETVYDELFTRSSTNVIGFMGSEDLKITLRNLVKQNPHALNDLLGGERRKPKIEVFTFFAGQLMRMVKGRADTEGMRGSLYSVLVMEYGVSTELFEKWKEMERNKKKEKDKEKRK